ncbi:MAG: glycoside hydrolase family 9 protein [Promethearchaeota archaeon]
MTRWHYKFKKESWILIILFCVSGAFVTTRLVAEGVRNWENDAPVVLVNQVGYLPSDPDKEFLVQYKSRLNGGHFEVISESTDNVVLAGDLQYLGILWENHYWRGNFSSLTASGCYHVKITFDGYPKQVKSFSFRIGDAVFDKARVLGYNFFYYQRCGCEVVDNTVPGYIGHAACHIDDADFENGTHRDVYGGWHDAGDYNKYNGYTALSFMSLVDSFYLDPAFFSTDDLNNTYPNSTGVDYHGDFPDILEEAIWGADYLVRLTDDDGFMLNLVGSNEYHGHYGFWGPPSDESDNDPSTHADNRILQNYSAGGHSALQTAYGLLKLANILNALGKSPERAIIYQDTAEKIFNYYSNQTLWYEPIKALINLELYKTTGNAVYKGTADEIGLENLQNSNALNWNTTGFRHTGNDYNFAYILLWALENGSLNVMTLAKERIEDRWINFWEPYYNSNDPTNFFHILKGHMGYTEYPNGTPVYNYYDEYFYHRYRDNSSDWNVGHNSYYLCAAWANALAYKISGDIKHLNFTLRMFDWILGRNPFNLCMCEGVGSFNPPKYHNRAEYVPGNPRGAVPGCVPNGIVRRGKDRNDPIYEKDLPYFDLAAVTPIYMTPDYTCTEPWLPHNAYFILALNALVNSTK